MKKAYKTFAVLSTLCFVGGYAPTVNAVAETEADKYSVEVTNEADAPEYLTNKTALTKGQPMTMAYTVGSLEHVEKTSTNRMLNIVASDSVSQKVYPDTRTGVAVSTLLSSNTSSAYPTLASTGYFDVGESYTVSFTPVGAGDTYNWSIAKVGGLAMKSGTIEYRNYIGINWYFFSFKLVLKDVSVVSGTTDLGVTAWDNGQPNDNALVVNTSALEGGMDMTKDNFLYTASEGKVETVEGAYYGKDVVQITPSGDSMKVYLTLPEMDSFALGEKAHLTFRMKVLGATGTYDDFRLNTWGDREIDYAYPRNTWNFVNFDAPVFEREGKKVICLSFTKIAGETVQIAVAAVSDDTFDTSNLFKGLQLYQVESMNILGMSYVLVTPSNKVIVIDGGYPEDAPNLFSLVKQYTTKIDAWYISHFHGDHAQTMIEMLENYDIVIDNLYVDYRDEAGDLNGFRDTEVTDLIAKFETVYAANKDKVNNFVQTKRQDVHEYGDGIRMKVLNDAWFGAPGNYGNESNVVFKLETPGEDVLFLGDLGPYGDRYLEDEWFVEEIRTCRVIQMAHHGQNGVSNLFYETIDDIKVCLYPALDWVYDASNGSGLGSASNLTTLKTRNLMRELGVRAIYKCGDGRVKLN